MIITNADIVGRLKLLAIEHVKADSGTTTTAVSSFLSDGEDFSNYFVCFISGLNIGIDKVITTFDVPTGVFTFDALSNPILSTDEICIVKVGFQSDVVQAENVIKNNLRNRGYSLDLFLTEPQLREMYIYKTIELACASKMNDGVDTDVYFVQYSRFKALYDQEISSLIADYDANENGVIDENEEDTKIGQIKFSR